ncbi:MAG: hypothetical protein QXR81_07345, partial [Candidatus Nezhaarchaeales archaeon]
IVKRVQASPEGLFIYIPSETRNRYEVDVGDAIRCTLIRLISRRGDRVEVNRSLILEVRGYWNELHLPQEALNGLNVEAGDYVELVLEEVIRGGGRVRIYGGRFVEGERDL